MPIINIATGQTLGNDMNNASQRLKDLIANKLPVHTEQRAQDIVDKSFQQEQYEEKGTSKWKGRKKEEQPGKEREGRRALLVKSARLISSTIAERRGGEVVIGSDTPYSQVHNEGLKAGKGAGFQMPQRQFMPIPGESNSELDEAMDKFMDDELDKIFG